jgi:hypothetical protein
VRAGYTTRTHNRWFSNWVAFRDRLSRDAVAFRIIRIAPKRIVFEISGHSDNLHRAEFRRRFDWKRVFLSVVALLLVVVLTALLSPALFAPEQSSSHTAAIAFGSQSPQPKPCVEIENLNKRTIVENTEAFSVEGWTFESQSKLVSLGQLASADFVATCMSVARDIRVLFIAKGNSWQIEKMAPTE